MLRGSFTISDDEHSDISQWIEKHKDICKMPSAIGGQFAYIFTPTSIGDLGKIKCNHCGESYTFRKLR